MGDQSCEAALITHLGCIEMLVLAKTNVLLFGKNLHSKFFPNNKTENPIFFPV
jgi:hypothetical protein